MRVVVLAVALCAATAPMASAALRPQTAAAADRRPGVWIAAVRAHEPDRADGALLTVAAWTPAEIQRILPRVAAERDAARLLAKGLVLHTDLGILEQAGRLAGHGTRIMTLEDGRASGNRQVSLQWRIGRLIAGALVALQVETGPGHEPRDAAAVERDRRERREVVRRWFYATAALLQEHGHLGFLHTHLNAGLSMLGDDAVLLMYRGTVRQAFADPRVQQFTRRRAGGVQASFELDQASRDLRRALALDPQLAEARIRLAHVLGDKGRHDEAAALLRPVMAAALAPFLDYYGALVLGRAEERLGRMAEARAAFERARRRFPDAQVPRVALSRLALLEGRADEALAGLVESPPAIATAPSDDPWWSYFRRHEPDAGALVAAMQERVR